MKVLQIPTMTWFHAMFAFLDLTRWIGSQNISTVNDYLLFHMHIFPFKLFVFFLGHHYFCFNCIKVGKKTFLFWWNKNWLISFLLVLKGFSKANFIPCPTCRNSTNMTGRPIEELATNNIVLRLVTIATDRARELAEREKKQHLIAQK